MEIVLHRKYNTFVFELVTKNYCHSERSGYKFINDNELDFWEKKVRHKIGVHEND